jgi:uncharacterized membrane protein (UPF0127 family)
LLAFLILAFLAVAPALADDLDHADLTVTTAAGQAYHFDVEVARTPLQQERGLMYRKTMPADAGMVFPFERDTTTSFWMKNCYIPLDMLFVVGDGHISHIVADAKPLFGQQPQPEDFIPSGGPVRLVVELNGGTAAKLGIHVGDKVAMPPSK